MIKIYYHNKDLDGFCSGAICRKYFTEEMSGDVEMIGWDYDDPQPVINQEDLYVITDISFNPETMKSLNDSQVIWIDHHDFQSPIRLRAIIRTLKE